MPRSSFVPALALVMLVAEPLSAVAAPWCDTIDKIHRQAQDNFRKDGDEPDMYLREVNRDLRTSELGVPACSLRESDERKGRWIYECSYVLPEVGLANREHAASSLAFQISACRHVDPQSIRTAKIEGECKPTMPGTSCEKPYFGRVYYWSIGGVLYEVYAVKRGEYIPGLDDDDLARVWRGVFFRIGG